MSERIYPELELARKMRRPGRPSTNRYRVEREIRLEDAIKAKDQMQIGYFIGSVLRILFQIFILIPLMCAWEVLRLIYLFFRYINEIMIGFLVLSMTGFVALILYLIFITYWT